MPMKGQKRPENKIWQATGWAPSMIIEFFAAPIPDVNMRAQLSYCKRAKKWKWTVMRQSSDAVYASAHAASKDAERAVANILREALFSINQQA